MNLPYVKKTFLIGLIIGLLISIGLLINQTRSTLSFDIESQGKGLAAYYWPEARFWKESDGSMKLLGEPVYLKVRVPVGYRHLKLEALGERAPDQALSLGLVSKGGIQLVEQKDLKNFEADLDLSIAERERGFVSLVFSAAPMKSVIGLYEVRLKISDPVWGQGSMLTRMRAYLQVTAQDFKSRLKELL